MTWQLAYYKEVESDLQSTKEWYKKHQDGLEKRFSVEVKKGLSKLQITPFIYEVRYRNIRIKHLDIFPFGIHYQVDEALKTITIIAILHHHQNPEIYYNR